MPRIGKEKQGRLWERYWGIRDDHRNGLAIPILWHLALRGDPTAMIELGSSFDTEGRIAQPFSQSGLAYRAWRAGSEIGAENLAVSAFNRRDLAGYRYWLARAARAKSYYVVRELRRFETRLPHENARLIRRKRPHRRYDFE